MKETTEVFSFKQSVVEKLLLKEMKLPSGGSFYFPNHAKCNVLYKTTKREKV